MGLRPKFYGFVIARGTIIRSTQVGTVMLPFKNGSQITFSNIIFTLECDLNFIFLYQLQATSILYHDNSEQKVLKQEEKIIGSVIRKKKLFIFNTPPLLRTILVKSRGRTTYLFSQNSEIRFRHRRLEHIYNTRII